MKTLYPILAAVALVWACSQGKHMPSEPRAYHDSEETGDSGDSSTPVPGRTGSEVDPNTYRGDYYSGGDVDVDGDGDGIADANDVCPQAPENYNGVDDSDGCPDRAAVHKPQAQSGQASGHYGGTQLTAPTQQGPPTPRATSDRKKRPSRMSRRSSRSYAKKNNSVPPGFLVDGEEKSDEKNRSQPTTLNGPFAGVSDHGLRQKLTQINADEVWIIVKNKQTDQKKQHLESDLGSGQMVTTISETKQVALPLTKTEVNAKILSYIATVNVKQRYHNPYNSKIEAVYMFPLPQDAAVSDFIMTIGKRKIRGIIRERAKAEEIYYRARRAGHVASLLTQERPNVFTQRVANIEPKKQIDIDLTYYNALPYRDGSYTFAFPMVVGPRFNPPGSSNGIGAAPRGKNGKSGQKSEVSYLNPTEDSGHRLSMTVELDAGVALEGLHSQNHKISSQVLSPSKRRITLAAGKTLPNKDFVLKYRVAGNKTKSAFFTHKDKTGQYFTMVLHPPANLKHAKRAPTEFVFVMDCSGSMSGTPLNKAKKAAIQALRALRPSDTFQVIRFSTNASRLGNTPLRATRANVERGIKYINSLHGTGGTMMIEGIKAALDYPHSPQRRRLVSFMTDGYIGNEADILKAITQKLGPTRLFSFGIGSSVNRFLLERMAVVGQGAVAYVGLDNDSGERAVANFYNSVRHPALTDLSIDFGNMRVGGLYPRVLPDLYVGRPVVVSGRFEGQVPRTVTLKGRVQGRPVAYNIAVSQASKHSALPKVWARMKMADLANRSFYSQDVRGLAGQVKETALNFGLMSPFTAFVAVDTSRKTEGTQGTTVHQSVPTPDGVRYDTTVP